MMEGQGHMIYADGSSYVGGFKQDELHGLGTLTYANGTVVKLRFKMGVPVSE
jgi:hypothetical protein